MAFFNEDTPTHAYAAEKQLWEWAKITEVKPENSKAETKSREKTRESSNNKEGIRRRVEKEKGNGRHVATQRERERLMFHLPLTVS